MLHNLNLDFGFKLVICISTYISLNSHIFFKMSVFIKYYIIVKHQWLNKLSKIKTFFIILYTSINYLWEFIRTEMEWIAMPE